MGKAALLIALIAATQTPIGPNLRSIVPVFAWGGTTHSLTLTEAAIDMAVSYDHMGVYQYKELDWKTGFGEYITDGSVTEDDCPRDSYHFYFPASGSGLKWQWYFPIRALDGCPAYPPPKGEFTNAYRWGRDGGGLMDDQQNWYGALKAYDYTPDSKQVAYRRLGHVAHLLEDMAAPDHANLAAHPGSAKTKSEILGMVAPLAGLLVGLAAGGVWGALASWALGHTMVVIIVWLAGERYGFEYLIRKRSVDWGKFLVPQPEPEYRASLKAYFDLMAEDSETELASSGLLNGRTALGVDDLFIGALELWGITVFQGFDTGIPLLPAIDPNNAAEVKGYSDLADSLLTKALARTAGLLMWYYDIVDFPPYVKQVSITQGGETKYKVEWQDMPQWDGDIGANRIVSRKPNLLSNKTLESGKPAEISVVFGPIGGTEKNPVPKKISRPEVRVGGVKVAGNLVADNVWKGEYTPQLGGCKEELKDIEIIAYDRDRHHIHGLDDDEGYRFDGQYGEKLDSDPASPAKLRGQDAVHWPLPPYDWIGYTPEWDKDHYKVTVKPTSGFASVTPTEASLLPLAGQSYHFNIIMSSGPADYKLKVLGLPVGAQAEFFPSASVHVPPPPHTANLILKITVSSSTPVGTYKLQIVDEQYTPPSPFVASPCYPEITLNVRFPTIQPMEADFTVSVEPSESTVEPGSSTTTKIRVSSVTLPIYGSTVSLSLSPPPAGFTLTLSPSSTSGQPYFERTMEVKVGSTVEAGKSYQITVTGTGSDGKTHSAIFTVFVKRPESRGDFAIIVNPPSSTVQAGSYTTAQVLVTSTAIPDVYTLPVTLSSSAPPGFMVTFSPLLPPAPPVFTRLMQVTVQPTVKPGSYTITITGTGTDYRIHYAIFTVLVTAPPVFTLPAFNFATSVSASFQSVPQGQSATYVVTITLVSGSTRAVSLDLRGLPSGATFYFRPNVGNPTFTSTLLVTTTTRTPLGDHVLTIVASGGGVVKSTTVTLRVVPPPIRASAKDCGTLAGRLPECPVLPTPFQEKHPRKTLSTLELTIYNRHVCPHFPTHSSLRTTPQNNSNPP